MRRLAVHNSNHRNSVFLPGFVLANDTARQCEFITVHRPRSMSGPCFECKRAHLVPMMPCAMPHLPCALPEEYGSSSKRFLHFVRQGCAQYFYDDGDDDDVPHSNSDTAWETRVRILLESPGEHDGHVEGSKSNVAVNAWLPASLTSLAESTA